MTNWLLMCTICGTEKRLNVGFNLALYGSRIYLYCDKCRRNTEQRVLGYIDDDGVFVRFEDIVRSRVRHGGETID